MHDILTDDIRATGPDVQCVTVQRLKLVTTVTSNRDALLIVRVLFYERHRYFTAHANGCGGEAVTYPILYKCAQSVNNSNPGKRKGPATPTQPSSKKTKLGT